MNDNIRVVYARFLKVVFQNNFLTLPMIFKSQQFVNKYKLK